jgi:hypothetical protein
MTKFGKRIVKIMGWLNASHQETLKENTSSCKIGTLAAGQLYETAVT